MYKAILVDDEILIREAIRDNIDWESLGFVLKRTCENGKQAIEAIEEEQPDLVLTDICMPFADGLEVSRYVYEHCPRCKVVIISGYDNFDYAQQAIRYQVMKYVLKPVTAQELKKLLTETKEELDKEKEQEEQLEKIRAVYERNKPYFRERLLNQMIRGKKLGKAGERQQKEYGIAFSGEYFSVIQICFAHPEDCDDLKLFILFNITEELVQQETGCISFLDMGNTATLILSGESEYHLEKRVQEVGNHILSVLTSHIRQPLLMVVGKSVTDPEDLSVSYDNVQKAKEYGFLFEDNSIVFGKELTGFYRQRISGENDWAAQLIPIIKRNEKAELQKEVRSCFDDIRTEMMTRTRAAIYLQSILMKLLFFVEEAGIRPEVRGDWEKKCLEEAFYRGNLDEMEGFLYTFCEEIAQELSAERDDLGRNMAVCAMEFIQKNYKASSLSLQQVCKFLAISTSYFSTLFKNQTGKTFVEALTDCRIEAAKELLSTTQMKSYEVAEAVGYSDAHYFSSIFKKNVGMTPKEYARKRSKV